LAAIRSVGIELTQRGSTGNHPGIDRRRRFQKSASRRRAGVHPHALLAVRAGGDLAVEERREIGSELAQRSARLARRGTCDGEHRTFWGFRVLAVDGSKILLPDSADVRDAFGTVPYCNAGGSNAGERPYAVASVLYDVLERVALDATLGAANAYEVDLAVGHLAHTCPGDLVLMDRNYPSYRMLAELSRHGRDFVVRCSRASFAPARRLLAGDGPDSRIVTLTPCHDQVARSRRRGLAASLTVRFVRVRLSTGEWEILVTSLLDETRYPTAGFRELYGLRWGADLPDMVPT
jgi:hypothetical protein